MESFYTAYTKVIDEKTYYFVKKFTRFPEFQNIEPILESYGMHTDFNKACAIAAVNDPALKQQLLNEINQVAEAQKAKVIELNKDFSGKKIAN